MQFLPAQDMMIMEGRENLEAESQEWENQDSYSPDSQRDLEPVVSSHWFWILALSCEFQRVVSFFKKNTY